MVIVGSFLNQDAPEPPPPPFSYLGMLFIYGNRKYLYQTITASRASVPLSGFGLGGKYPHPPGC